MDARDFFLDQLARFFIERRGSHLGAGSLAFSVQDQGKFTVRLSDDRSSVEEGFDKKADVKLWFFGEAFTHFLEGTLSTRPTSKELLVRGDLDVLERFGRILEGTKTLYSVRM